MKFLEFLMIANVVVFLLALATSGKTKVFFFKLSGVVFIVAIVTVGTLVNNGILRN